MNKKLTSILIIAFMLTFAVGSAFALGAGRLEVTGTVNVAMPRNVDNHFQTTTPAALDLFIPYYNNWWP